MNRRKFLQALGLAPISAPLVLPEIVKNKSIYVDEKPVGASTELSELITGSIAAIPEDEVLAEVHASNNARVFLSSSIGLGIMDVEIHTISIDTHRFTERRYVAYWDHGTVQLKQTEWTVRNNITQFIEHHGNFGELHS